MMRVLPLYAMAREESFDGMVLAKGMVPNFEATQCIKEAMEHSWDDVGAPLISFTQCQGILRCGQSQATSSS